MRGTNGSLDSNGGYDNGATTQVDIESKRVLNATEADYLLHSHHKDHEVVVYKSYKSRWWILTIFTLLSLNQCNFWITFSTFSILASSFYNTPISYINLLGAIGPIIFIPFSVVFSWSINRYGVRKNMLMASSLVAAGGVIRAVAGQGSSTFFLVVIGQVLNSIAGPIVMVLPTKLSATWFPVEQRTFSTAVASLANFSGSAIGFILALFATSFTHLRILLYGEAASAVIIFILICIYFPEKPKTPPSASSSDSTTTIQMSLIDSWKDLFHGSLDFLRGRSALILTITCGLTSGCYASWSTYLVEMVVPMFSESEGKWMGFYGILAGLFGGMICGIIHDKFHNFKRILIIIFILNTTSYLLFSLLVQGYLPSWYWLAQLFNISGGWFVNGFYPIIYEAAVEVSYPISPGIGSSIISIWLNVVTFVAIMIGSVIPSYYLNWIVVGSSGFSTFLLLFLKEEYKRSNNDNKLL